MNKFLMVLIQPSSTCVILFITGLDHYIQYMQNTHTPNTSRPTQALLPNLPPSLSLSFALPLCSPVVVSNSWHVCMCVSVRTGSPLGGVMTQIKISCSGGLWHHQQITHSSGGGLHVCVCVCMCVCVCVYMYALSPKKLIWSKQGIEGVQYLKIKSQLHSPTTSYE